MDEKELKAKQCKIIIDQIEDERMAVTTYNALAKLLKDSENPGICAMSILAENIADSELSHMVALQKLATLHCPK